MFGGQATTVDGIAAAVTVLACSRPGAVSMVVRAVTRLVEANDVFFQYFLQMTAALRRELGEK